MTDTVQDTNRGAGVLPCSPAPHPLSPERATILRLIEPVLTQHQDEYHGVNWKLIEQLREAFATLELRERQLSACTTALREYADSIEAIAHSIEMEHVEYDHVAELREDAEAMRRVRAEALPDNPARRFADVIEWLNDQGNSYGDPETAEIYFKQARTLGELAVLPWTDELRAQAAELLKKRRVPERKV